MSSSAPAADSPEGHIDPQVSDEAVRRLVEAVAHLANDPDYFVQALTDMLLAMRPIPSNSLTKQHEQFLIESGAYTAEELDAAAREADRGALRLRVAETWLSQLLATISLEDATGLLEWTEEDVQDAVSDGRLYAIEISDRLRFPAWQFNVGSPEKLIPGLTEILDVVTPRWSWQSVAAFMSTPQSSLVAEGRQTPVEWLRDGGDVNAVKQIIETNDWR